MRCDHCGWEWDPGERYDPPEIPKMEEMRDYPPLPLLHPPHPVDWCPSPFTMGDSLWWNLSNKTPDLPPIRGIYAGIGGFLGPEFEFQEDGWAIVSESVPGEARFVVIPDSVLQGHLRILEADFSYGMSEDREINVPIHECVAIERWPKLEVGEAI